MEIFALTSMGVSLILLGVIVGIYIQIKLSQIEYLVIQQREVLEPQINLLNSHINSLQNQILELKKVKNDTQIEAKKVPEWDEITDPNIKWDK